MKKTRRFLYFVIPVMIVVFLSSCGSRDFPSAEAVSQYSYEELHTFADTVTLQQLHKNWGDPQTANHQEIWTVPLDGGCKFVTAQVDDGRLISIGVSFSLFVTVTEVQETAALGTVGWDSYTTDPGTLTVLPDTDCFGNEIPYHIGDLYFFEFDGIIMETYPAQMNHPYYAALMGQLTGPGTEPTPTGYPSGSPQRPQVFHNGRLYCYDGSRFDALLPEGFAFVGCIDNIDDWNEPTQELQGARVEQGQAVFADGQKPEVLYVQYSSGYARFVIQ